MRGEPPDQLAQYLCYRVCRRGSRRNVQQGLLWRVYQGFIDRVEQFVLGVEDIVQGGQWRIRRGRDATGSGIRHTIFRDHLHGGLNKILPAHFGAHSSHSASPSSVLPPGDWSAVDRDEC